MVKFTYISFLNVNIFFLFIIYFYFLFIISFYLFHMVTYMISIDWISLGWYLNPEPLISKANTSKILDPQGEELHLEVLTQSKE